MTQAGVVRAGVTALGQITAAADPTDFPTAAASFQRLLQHSLDPRPKVRRAAHAAVRDVLAALQSGPAGTNASDALVKGRSSTLIT